MWPERLRTCERRRSSTFVAFLLPTLAAYGAWVLGQWPGYFNLDSLYNIGTVREGRIAEWVSYTYSVYLRVLQSITPNVGLISLVNVTASSLGIAALFAWAHDRSDRRGQMIGLACFFLMLTHPLVGALLNSVNRDTFFAILHVATAGYFFVLVTELRSGGRWIRWREALCLALLTAMTAQVRMEAVVVLGVVPALFLLLVRQKVNRLRFLVSLAAVALPLGVASYGSYQGEGVTYSYRLTSIVNPLSYLVARGYASADHAADRAVIDKVMNYDLLQRLQSDYEIPPFHQGGLRPYPGDEAMREFLSTYRRMLWENKLLYLGNRARLFDATLGDKRHNYYHEDGLTLDALKEEQAKLRIEKAPFSEWLQALTSSSLRSVFRLPNPLFLLYCTAWPAFLLVTANLAAFRWLPVSAAAAAIIFCRLPTLFLFSPASQFKYIFSLFAFGFLVVPLALAEWNSRKRKT